MAEVYRVRFRSRSVRKDLDDLDDETYLRIAVAIFHLRENPRPAGTKKLTGQEAYRIRIGNYRILYTVDDKARAVQIAAVRKRDERTYDRRASRSMTTNPPRRRKSATSEYLERRAKTLGGPP